MKTWCKHKWCDHIDWDSDNDNHHRYYWQFNDGQNNIIPVARNWKVCPICKTKRPEDPKD